MLILTAIISMLISAIVAYFVMAKVMKDTVSKDLQYTNTLLNALLESKGIEVENSKPTRQKLAELNSQRTKLYELRRDSPEKISEQEYNAKVSEIEKQIDDLRLYRSIRTH